jgi:hypothetical protein
MFTSGYDLLKVFILYRLWTKIYMHFETPLDPIMAWMRGCRLQNSTSQLEERSLRPNFCWRRKRAVADYSWGAHYIPKWTQGLHKARARVWHSSSTHGALIVPLSFVFAYCLYCGILVKRISYLASLLAAICFNDWQFFPWYLRAQYAFGENDCYNVSKAFIGTRQWLQQKYQLGVPFVWGRMGSLVPLRVQLHIEVNDPRSFPICPSSF